MKSPEMPLPEKKENLSAIKRVIGVPKEKEEKIKAQFAERFSKQEIPKFKELGIKEIEKSPEQIEIIKYIGELTSTVSKKYSGEELIIPANNVHILIEKDYKKIFKKETSAAYTPSFQAISLKEKPSLLFFAMVLTESIFHENIHFKSYQTCCFFEDKGGPYLKQVGLLIFGKTAEVEYFRNLNEAVTQELTKRVLNEEFLNKEVLKKKKPNLFELFEEEVEKVEDMQKFLQEKKDSSHPEEILSSKIKNITLPEGNKIYETKLVKFEKFKERKILNNLIEKLYSKNKEKFKDKEEVFDLFAESLFTGKLRWASLVNKSFGVGALQKLAKADKNVDELGKFVDGLKV